LVQNNEDTLPLVANHMPDVQTRRANQNEVSRLSLSSLNDDVSERDSLTEQLKVEINELRREVNNLTEYSTSLQVN